ncbi:hypothetical protein JW752_01720 [Candidatus Peregrinibacteria bacterium]|nr:hypothetical protein [Candidatus Peregrinibacteria bacterium]
MEKEPKMSPEDIAKIQTERTLSDAEKIKGGAKHVVDKQGSEPRLEFTGEQVEQAQKEMESELRERLVNHEKQLFEALQKAISEKNYEEAARLSNELAQHIKKDSGEDVEVVTRPEQKPKTEGTPYEFVDMTPHIRHENLQSSYYAGGQLEILKDAFDAEWVIAEKEDDYQGEYYAVFIKDGKWHIMNGYFGSCSGCDDLEDANPKEWLESYVKNVRAFDSKEALVKWLEETEDYSYGSIKNEIIEKL